MNELIQKRQRLTACLDEAQTALDANQMEDAGRLRDEAKALQAEITVLESADTLRRDIGAARDYANALKPITYADPAQQARDAVRTGAPGADAPSYARYGRLTAFKTEEKAYRFGKFVLAALGHSGSREFCGKNGIQLLAQTEAVNSGGGFLVPHEFGNELIDLREQYGVFRRNAKIEPMTSETKSVLRRKSGLTAYFVGENAEGTESEKAWDRVNLTAKKLMCLTKYSSEVSEDAVISIGNDLAEEMAYAFAYKEDLCGFIGTGTSTYGRIVGVGPSFTNLDSTIANIAGLSVAAGNLYSEFTLAEFEAAVGMLPQYADRGNAKWYMHRYVFYNVCVRLALAAGGVTEREVLNGAETTSFLGYPVEITQALPKADANSQVGILFGDLRLTASLGDRRQVTIAGSEHVNFTADELVIKGTERIDINVHDVGNASATAGSRVVGPMVGIISAAA